MTNSILQQTRAEGYQAGVDSMKAHVGQVSQCSHDEGYLQGLFESEAAAHWIIRNYRIATTVLVLIVIGLSVEVFV